MKTVHNGKQYNSANCETLASRDHHSHSNNYSGTTRLILAKNGQYLLHTNSNGQDCYLTDDLSAISAADAAEWLEGLDLDEDETARLAELKLIEIV